MSEPPPFVSQEGLHVDVYEELLAAEATSPVEGDVDFFIDMARQTGGPVLEIGCGTGRVAWPIAEAGFEVVGLDPSRPMLAKAEAKRATQSDEAGARIQFTEGDMRHFDLGRSFRLIVLAFRTFQLILSPSEQRSALQAMKRHLLPDGRLVIDVFDPRFDRLVPGAPAPVESAVVVHPSRRSEVSVRVTDREVDPVTQTLREVWAFQERNAAGEMVVEEREELTLRWCYRQEMRYLFEITGFTVEAEYSDFFRSPPAYGKEQVWVATPKPAQ